MEIILLEKVVNVGDVGDLVRVRPGYARNFLIPGKKALRATPEAIAEVTERKRQLAEQEGRRLEDAQARAEAVVRALTLVRLCGDAGQLYGSVSPVDIAEALTEAGTPVEKSEISQPDGPVKHVGEHEAEVILHPEVRFTIAVAVHGENGLTSVPVDAVAGDAEAAPAEAGDPAAEAAEAGADAAAAEPGAPDPADEKTGEKTDPS